jgi:hypothetical protein
LELQKIDNRADIVLDLLGELGEVPPELQNEIYMTRDIEVLTKMLKMAMHSKSIEDFQTKLEEMKCCL